MALVSSSLEVHSLEVIDNSASLLEEEATGGCEAVEPLSPVGIHAASHLQRQSPLRGCIVAFNPLHVFSDMFIFTLIIFFVKGRPVLFARGIMVAGLLLVTRCSTRGPQQR